MTQQSTQMKKMWDIYKQTPISQTLFIYHFSFRLLRAAWVLKSKCPVLHQSLPVCHWLFSIATEAKFIWNSYNNNNIMQFPAWRGNKSTVKDNTKRSSNQRQISNNNRKSICKYQTEKLAYWFGAFISIVNFAFFSSSGIHKSWYLFAKSLNWECLKCFPMISYSSHFKWVVQLSNGLF